MSSRKKFLLVFGFIVLNMFMLVSFLVIRDATMENELKNEMEYLSKLDITKDRYNKKTVTRGKYAVVEKSIKKYLDDYHLELQEVLKLINDKELTTILSYDNYSTDGPEFTKSLEYLNTSKDTFNKKVDDLINKFGDEEIKNNIYKSTKEEYYVNLYDNLMLSSNMRSNYNSTIELLKSTKSRMNNVYDTSIEVLNFLVLYKDDWVVEDGEIKFKTQDLYNYYNELISKVSTKKSE
mgnify:FL=1